MCVYEKDLKNLCRFCCWTRCDIHFMCGVHQVV